MLDNESQGMDILSGLEYTKECVQNICRDVKDTVQSWYIQHVAGPEAEDALTNSAASRTVDFVAPGQSKGIWAELRKEHEQLATEQERARDEFRSIRQVVLILQNDYVMAKESIFFTRYSLLKAMIKRSIMYTHLRQDEHMGEVLTTGKQRQEMRQREESVAGLSRHELQVANKELKELLRQYKCKTALILDMLRTLEQNYQQSKHYMAFRRYRMLKCIIKSVIHSQWLQE